MDIQKSVRPESFDKLRTGSSKDEPLEIGLEQGFGIMSGLIISDRKQTRVVHPFDRHRCW